jgi:hypothetical protein
MDKVEYVKSLEGSTVAVLDDKRQEAELMCDVVETAGMRPCIIEGRFRKIKDVLKRHEKTPFDLAICDQRLKHGKYAAFDGAELVYDLIRIGVPAILVSQFVGQDLDTSIRMWRHGIPVVLTRDEADSNGIVNGFRVCAAEMDGIRLLERKPVRCLIEVLDKRPEGKGSVLDVLVTQWQHSDAVSFPVSMLPSKLRKDTKIGTLLIADVNVGARRSMDLFFQNFTLAPEVDPNDGLGID